MLPQGRRDAEKGENRIAPTQPQSASRKARQERGRHLNKEPLVKSWFLFDTLM